MASSENVVIGVEPLVMVTWRAWAESMRARGLAPGTIASRRSTWRSWEPFIGERMWVADHHDVERWLAGRPLGPAAAQRAVSDLTQLYKWGRREDLTTADPTALVQLRRRPRGVPRPLSPAVVRAALVTPDRRLAVTVALMAYGGLRCVEVERLVVGDIDHASGAVYVTGKGGHTRWVPIVAPMRPYLFALDGLEPSDPIFPRADGAPGSATAARISQLVSRWLRTVTGGPASAHQLRHAYAVQVLIRTGSLEVVQHALGHASIATTQIYAEMPHSPAMGRIADAWGDTGDQPGMF